MTGWTILTARGRRNEDYEKSKYDDTGRGTARDDLAATANEDDRVHKFETYSRGHVYMYLDCSRYNWDFAEVIMEDYSQMIDDAVVLGANDTTDMGDACYYPDPAGGWTDKFKETEHGMVGQTALNVINARHGIHAQDPFHDKTGWYDDSAVEYGTNRLPDYE